MFQASIVVYRFYFQSALEVAEDFIFIGHRFNYKVLLDRVGGSSLHRALHRYRVPFIAFAPQAF